MKRICIILVLCIVSALAAAASAEPIIPASRSGEIITDAGSNGKVNTRDVIALMKAVASGDTQRIPELDVNGDGKLNGRDVIALMKIIITGQEEADLPSYDEYLDSFVVPADELKNGIENAFNERFGRQIVWANADSPYNLRCYYADGDIAVLFDPGNLDVITTLIVGDAKFVYGASFALWVYHDGEITPADQAYGAGTLGGAAIASAAERHETVQKYIRFVLN